VEGLRLRNTLTFLALLTIQPSVCSACTFVDGYFYQVTDLHGQVVGRRLGPLQFRWLRQSFNAKGANLTLYEYRPSTRREHLKNIAAARADDGGRFNFNSIQEGHYILIVEAKDLGEQRFDVEVTPRTKATTSVLIDVSPVRPDCTGGHEFIVRVKG